MTRFAGHTDPGTRAEPADGIRGLRQKTSGQGVRVAVIDSRVDPSHPSLSAANLSELMPAWLRSRMAPKGAAHGTHIASTLFGQPGSSVDGIAPGAEGLIIPIYGEAEDGELINCSQLDLARAISLAIGSGAHIINISGGEPIRELDYDPYLAKAIADCERMGVLVVAATGNEGEECLHSPASFDEVLAVGATDGAGMPLPFSNWHPSQAAHGVVAPGERMPGAAPGGGIELRTGTSFACPVAAGVATLLAALQLERDGKVDGRRIRAALVETATPCGAGDGPGDPRCLGGQIAPLAAHARLFGVSNAETSGGHAQAAFGTSGRSPPDGAPALHLPGLRPAMDPTSRADGHDMRHNPNHAQINQHAGAAPGAFAPAGTAPEALTAPSAEGVAPHCGGDRACGCGSEAGSAPSAFDGAAGLGASMAATGMPAGMPAGAEAAGVNAAGQPAVGTPAAMGMPPVMTAAGPVSPLAGAGMAPQAAPLAPHPALAAQMQPAMAPQAAPQALAAPQAMPMAGGATPSYGTAAAPAPGMAAQVAPSGPQGAPAAPPVAAAAGMGVMPASGRAQAGPTPAERMGHEIAGIQPSNVAPSMAGGSGQIAANPMPTDFITAQNSQLVYAIGEIGYDFITDARRDYYMQGIRRMSEDKDGQAWIAQFEESLGLKAGPIYVPEDHRAMSAYIYQADSRQEEDDPAPRQPSPSAEEVAGLVFVMLQDGQPLYALRPLHSFSGATYYYLARFLFDQSRKRELDDGAPNPRRAERISIAGRIIGDITLYSGQTVPMLDVGVRGLFNWNTQIILDDIKDADPELAAKMTAADGAASDPFKQLENFLQRIYYEVRNLGQAPQDRAINYLATNTYQAYKALAESFAADMVLDSIHAEPSPLCRPKSECYDVIMRFFNPNERLKVALREYRLTVDVNDIVPIGIGDLRQWERYA